MSRASWLRRFAIFGIALLGAGCFGQRKEPTPVTLFLLWEPQAQFLGYYVAAERGFFKDEGMEVSIRHDIGIGDSFRAIMEGKHSFGINQFTNYIDSLDRFPEIYPVSIINKGCNIGWVTTAQPDRLIDALAKNPVYSWWGPHDRMLRALLMSSAKAVSDLPKRVRSGYPDASVPSFSVLAMSYNEIMDFDGKKGSFKTYCELGFPIFEDTLIAREPANEEEAELHARMSRAIWKGWDWSMKFPNEALRILMSRNPRRPIEAQKKQLEIFGRSLSSTEDAGSSFVQVRDSMEKMRSFGLIAKSSGAAYDRLISTLFRSDSRLRQVRQGVRQ